MSVTRDRDSPALVWLLGVIAAVCLIWLLRAAAVVVMPLFAAFFIAITVYPVLAYLEKRLGRFRWAALPLTMALIVAVIGGGIWALAESVDEAVEAAPKYSGRMEEVWRTVEESASGYGVPIPDDLLSSTEVRQRLGRAATSAARAAWATISGLVLVFFLVILMLLEVPAWRAGTRRFMGDDRRRAAIETLAEIAEKVRRYLYIRTVLGAVSAAVAGIWLLVLDVDLVLVWVALTFLLNYIPNLGSILAVIPPSLMALLQHGPVMGAVVLGGLTVFEQIIGNYIEPRMEGRRLRVSPVVVLAALIFWTWMWGPVGAILAMPVTVAVLVSAAHVPALRPLAIALANDVDETQPGKKSRPSAA